MEGQRSRMIERVDIHIMETPEPTLDRGDFMRMVCNTINSKMEQTWRVRLHEDGTVALHSFAMPLTKKNLDSSERLNDASLLPIWVQERLAVLQICQQGDILEGVGQKVSERVFYVIE